MKFYIATSLDNAEQHNAVRDALVAQGHTITHDWTQCGVDKGPSVEELRKRGDADIEGVLQADLLIVLLPGGKGTHVELGLMIAKMVVLESAKILGEERRPQHDPVVLTWGKDIQAFQEPYPCAFHWSSAVCRMIGGDPASRIPAWVSRWSAVA